MKSALCYVFALVPLLLNAPEVKLARSYCATQMTKDEKKTASVELGSSRQQALTESAEDETDKIEELAESNPDATFDALVRFSVFFEFRIQPFICKLDEIAQLDTQSADTGATASAQ